MLELIKQVQLEGGELSKISLQELVPKLTFDIYPKHEVGVEVDWCHEAEHKMQGFVLDGFPRRKGMMILWRGRRVHGSFIAFCFYAT